MLAQGPEQVAADTGTPRIPTPPPNPMPAFSPQYVSDLNHCLKQDSPSQHDWVARASSSGRIS